jgi:hypothetical protein
MNAIDTLFFIFFLSFIPISWFIDAAALGLSFWPPNTTKRLVAWWVRLCDPLLGTPPLWFRAMTWFEVLVYPFFCAASCIAIYRGLGKSRWIRLPAVVFASIVGYSFLFIVAEYTFGSYKNPAPWIFMSAYLPFFILPILFAYRTFHPAKRLASTSTSSRRVGARKTRKSTGTNVVTTTSSPSEKEEKKQLVIPPMDEPRKLRSRDAIKRPSRMTTTTSTTTASNS